MTEPDKPAKPALHIDEAITDVIRAPGHKSPGSRSTQVDPSSTKVKARVVFAQEAILRIFPHGRPAERPRDLLRRVRDELEQTAEWSLGWEPISRYIVNRAWDELNRP